MKSTHSSTFNFARKIGSTGLWCLVMGILAGAWAIIAPSSQASAAASGPIPTSVVATVSGMRSDTGKVVAFMFLGSKGFPAKRKRAAHIVRARIKDGRARLDFDGLQPGEYAISMFHDEDGDDRLDLNFIGLPKEGLAISNGEKAGIAYPRYSVARFDVAPGQTRLSVTMLYWLD